MVNEEFTTLFFTYGIYNVNKTKIQKLRTKYGLKWITNKQKLEIPHLNIIEVFKIFKSEDRIINDENLKGRTGSTGVWESGKNETLKMVSFDKRSEDEHLPILLVYRGIERDFYRELIELCISVGCEVGKVISTENGLEEIFKKRINIELVEKLKSVEGSKDVMKEMFINKIDEFRKHGHQFSDSFVEGWKGLIDKYGYYTSEDLYNDIHKRSEESEKGKPEMVKDSSVKEGRRDEIKKDEIKKDEIKKDEVIKMKVKPFKRKIFIVKK